MLGAKLKDLKLQRKKIPHVGVKEVVLPFNMFPEVDPVLGPEMRSTGEVLGLAASFGLAFCKAQEAAKATLPQEGAVLLSVAEKDEDLVYIGREFQRLGFKLRATRGTQAFLQAEGVAAEVINKQHEGRPHITDAIANKEIQLVINTPAGRQSQYDDSYIRKAAIRCKIPYITTLAAAVASVKGIAAGRAASSGVKSLQRYHQEIGS